MSTTRRLLLPWVLVRLGARAFKAPRLSAYRPDAVGAVARRSLPCLRIPDGRGFGQLGAVQVASDATVTAGDLAQMPEVATEHRCRVEYQLESTK